MTRRATKMRVSGRPAWEWDVSRRAAQQEVGSGRRAVALGLETPRRVPKAAGF